MADRETDPLMDIRAQQEEIFQQLRAREHIRMLLVPQLQAWLRQGYTPHDLLHALNMAVLLETHTPHPTPVGAGT